MLDQMKILSRSVFLVVVVYKDVFIETCVISVN